MICSLHDIKLEFYNDVSAIRIPIHFKANIAYKSLEGSLI
jgi:hypothetical protein